MKVVLDTSVIFGGKGNILAWKNLNELFTYCKAHDIDIIIPEVVLLELKNKWKEQIEEHNRLIDSVIKSNRLFETAQEIEEMPLVSEADEISKLDDLLLNNVQGAKVEIVNNSQSHISEAIQRSLEHKKPASSKDKGLRDTFIWLSIRSEFQKLTEKFIFISGNSNDFASKDGSDLHPSLLAELSSSLENEDRQMLYYLSIASFLRSEVDNPEIRLRLAQNELNSVYDELSYLGQKGFIMWKEYKNSVDKRFHNGSSWDEALETSRSDRDIYELGIVETDRKSEEMHSRREALEKEIEALELRVKGKK